MGGIVEQKTKVRFVAVLLLELDELVCDLLIALDSCFPSLFQGQVRHFFEYRARKWRADGNFCPSDMMPERICCFKLLLIFPNWVPNWLVPVALILI